MQDYLAMTKTQDGIHAKWQNIRQCVERSAGESTGSRKF